jgi:hypothetical protein
MRHFIAKTSEITHGTRPNSSVRAKFPQRHHLATCVAHSISSALYQTFLAGQAEIGQSQADCTV